MRGYHNGERKKKRYSEQQREACNKQTLTIARHSQLGVRGGDSGMRGEESRQNVRKHEERKIDGRQGIGIGMIRQERKSKKTTERANGTSLYS